MKVRYQALITGAAIATTAFFGSTLASTATPHSTPDTATTPSTIAPFHVPTHAEWVLASTDVMGLRGCNTLDQIFPCALPDGTVITEGEPPASLDPFLPAPAPIRHSHPRPAPRPAPDVIETFEDGSIINHTTGWRGCPVSNPEAICHD